MKQMRAQTFIAYAPQCAKLLPQSIGIAQPKKNEWQRYKPQRNKNKVTKALRRIHY